jgi:hypothetical protein
MPRIRINKDGIAIAKQGYDVDTTSPANMLFTSNGIAARVYETGLTTVSSYSGKASDRYRRSRVNFSKTFAAPPPVFVAGLLTGGGADINPVYQAIIGNSYARIHPVYSVEIDKTGFYLYVANFSDPEIGFLYGSKATTWRWWVLDCVLED